MKTLMEFIYAILLSGLLLFVLVVFGTLWSVATATSLIALLALWAASLFDRR